MKPKLPMFIGLCGVPKSGKTLVQGFLQTNFGVTPVDDGQFLRQIAIDHFGAKPDDVHTQEGKAQLAYWPNGEPQIDARDGSHMTWRQVLGKVGKMMEQLYGPYVMPMTAVAKIDCTPGASYSFGSVRMQQGEFYKRQGGVIIGINNPLAKPTGNDFDEFDHSLVDTWINNDALARGFSHQAALADLEEKVTLAVADVLDGMMKAA